MREIERVIKTTNVKAIAVVLMKDGTISNIPLEEFRTVGKISAKGINMHYETEVDKLSQGENVKEVKVFVTEQNEETHSWRISADEFFKHAVIVDEDVEKR